MHSAVEFADAVIAQLGLPDMRLPIQLALTWPRSVPMQGTAHVARGDRKATFYAPDWRGVSGGAESGKVRRLLKGDHGAVLNGANEAAVGLFLNDKIGFTDIAERVAYALDTIPYKKDITLDDVLAADKAAREDRARLTERSYALLQIILAILAFGVLVIVHEFGHFITAKRGGVQGQRILDRHGPDPPSSTRIKARCYCLKAAAVRRRVRHGGRGMVKVKTARLRQGEAAAPHAHRVCGVR